MHRFSLNGKWDCSYTGGSFVADVPGCFDIYMEERDFAGVVTYKKEVTIEKKEDCRYALCCGAVSYYCNVYVNGAKCGSHEGMWDSFEVDITDALCNGNNTVTLEVTKPGYDESDRFPLRQVLSGFIPDVLHTFGGIWQDIAIVECYNILVTNAYAKGDKNGKGELTIKYTLHEAAKAMLSCSIMFGEEKVADISCEVEGIAGENTLTVPFEVVDAKLWSVHTPNMYEFTATLSCGWVAIFLKKSFGFRSVEADSTQVLLNDTPVYQRGILHWGYYDDIIAPLPTREQIQYEIDKIKECGFNMVKHCLYIPTEDYLDLADKNGVMLWIELPLWLPEVTPQLHTRMRYEYPRMLERIAGHPSVVMVSLGCELNSDVSGDILSEMYDLAKSGNVLVRDNSGSGECYGGLTVDHADFFDYHFYGDLHNMEQLMETFTPSWRGYRPWVFGEFCDMDTMRDLANVRKGKGVDVLKWETNDKHTNPISILKPDFFLHMHDERMEKSGIRADFPLIEKLANNHALTHRKVTLEMTRSFPEICGYNITSIRDVPIATSGIFDDLNKLKFDPNHMSFINADVALVPAWDLTRVWINGDRVRNKPRYSFFGGTQYGLHILMSNYGNKVAETPTIKWTLWKGGAVIEGSQAYDGSVAIGEVKEVCYINFTLPNVDKPTTYSLDVTVKGENWCNTFPVFVYPTPVKCEKKIGVYDTNGVFAYAGKLYDFAEIGDDMQLPAVDIIFTTRLTPAILQFAKDGGKVLYVARGKSTLPTVPVSFWREGIVRCMEHDVLEGVTYDTWQDDLRFYDLATDTAFDVTEWSDFNFDKVTPIIKRYDCREWRENDYMVEITHGEGSIIATTLRLEGGFGKQSMLITGSALSQHLIHNIINS